MRNDDVIEWRSKGVAWWIGVDVMVGNGYPTKGLSLQSKIIKIKELSKHQDSTSVISRRAISIAPHWDVIINMDSNPNTLPIGHQTYRFDHILDPKRQHSANGDRISPVSSIRFFDLLALALTQLESRYVSTKGQILDEFWTYWIKEFLKGICKRVMTLGELGEIIREVFVKLLLDSFGKLSISYESVDVVIGENWLLRHKAEMVCHEKVVKMPCVPKELVGFTPRRRIGFRMELVQGAMPICEGSCRLMSLERQEVWNDCRSCKVRVGSNGNLLWEASVLLGRKKGCVMDTLKFTAMPFGLTNAPAVFMKGVRVTREDDRGVTKGREDVREVFQQRGSGAKRKLSRCGRNQMGNEPILALPEGADDFVVYYDARSKDLEACLEKGEGDCLYVATTEGSYEGLHG
ncbi:hypothetical protein Tco_0085431 [Tanacetum coccineum]